MLSARGRLDGREFLSEESWQALHAHPAKALMGSLLTTRFTQGGVDFFTACTPQSTQAERDFNEGRAGTFIVAGIVFTVLFIGTVYGVVRLVLENAGR